jgi:hypothetical protein
MPNSEEYAKRVESTPIPITGRVFSLHHSATISYHFDSIFIPNALEMTTFKWCQIARKWLDILEVIGCWTSNWQYCLWDFKFDDWKHQIHLILFPHQSMYAMPNHLPIICQKLIIWKLLLSEQLEFWKARSLKNGDGSSRQKKWMNMLSSEYMFAEPRSRNLNR